MRRREFIALGRRRDGRVAVQRGRAAGRARAADRRAVGLCGKTDPTALTFLGAFRQNLAALGWREGSNLYIDLRWTAGDINRAASFAKEPAALQPDAILANTTPITAAVQHETKTIPIVFVVVADPVGSGLVESLARPGGNTTGFTALEYGVSAKWLELLKEIAPRVTRVAVLRDLTIRNRPIGGNPGGRAGAGRGVDAGRRSRCW